MEVEIICRLLPLLVSLALVRVLPFLHCVDSLTCSHTSVLAAPFLPLEVQVSMAALWRSCNIKLRITFNHRRVWDSSADRTQIANEVFPFSQMLGFAISFTLRFFSKVFLPLWFVDNFNKGHLKSGHF